MSQPPKGFIGLLLKDEIYQGEVPEDEAGSIDVLISHALKAPLLTALQRAATPNTTFHYYTKHGAGPCNCVFDEVAIGLSQQDQSNVQGAILF